MKAESKSRSGKRYRNRTKALRRPVREVSALPRAVQRLPLLAAAAASVVGVNGLLGTSRATAATFTWSGATSNVWNVSTNWLGNALPTTGNLLLFNNSPTSGLDLNNNLTTSGFNIAGITFNTGAGAFVIGDGSTNADVGNPFTLTSTITNASGVLQTINDPFVVSATRTISPEAGGIVLGGNITGAGGISETVSGALTLSGSNTYSGSTTVTSTTLNLTNINAISTSALTLNGATLNLYSNSSATFADASTALTGSATINVDNNGTGTGNTLAIGGLSTNQVLTLTNGDGYNLSIGAVTSTSNATFANNMANGTTTIASFTDSAGASETFTASGTSATATTIVSGALAQNGANKLNVTQSGAGTLVLAGASAITGTISASSGTLSLTGSLSAPTGVSLTGTGILLEGSTGVIGGSGTLTINTPGITSILSGANTYSGLTTVTAGVLQFGNAAAIASGNAASIATGGTLDVGGYSPSLGLLSNAGQVTDSGSAAVLTIGNGSTGAGSFTGALSLVWNQGATNSALTGSMTFTGGLTLNATSTGTLSVGTVNNTGTITNSGSGSGTATITGVVGTNVTGVFQTSATSALTLNGANTFTSGLNIVRGVVSSSTATTGGFGNGPVYLGNTASSNTDSATLLYTGSGSSVSNAITVEAGSTGILAIEGQSNNNVFTGPITVNNAVTLANLTANQTTFSGVINGSSPVNIGSNASVANGITNVGTVTIAGTSITSTTTYAGGQTAITLATVPLGITSGDLISGPNIPAGTTVTGVSGTTLNLSAATTGASTNNGSVAFTGLSGVVTLNSGSLTLNTALALGTGAFVINGGALGGSATLVANNVQTWNGDFTYDTTNGLNMGTGAVSLGTLTTGTARTVNFTAAGNLTIGGMITNGSGTAAGVTTLIKSGSTGTLTLNNVANAFSNLTINGGTGATVQQSSASGNFATPTDLGTPLGTGTIFLNSGTLALSITSGGSFASYSKLDNNIALGGAVTIVPGGGGYRDLIMSGLISGSGPLTLILSQTNGGDAGTGVYLAGANNTYSGGTALNVASNPSNLVGAIEFVAEGANALGGGAGGTGGVVTFENLANLASQNPSYLVVEAPQSIAGINSSTANANGLGATYVTGYSPTAGNVALLTINNTAGATGDGASYSGTIGGTPSNYGNVTATAAAGNNIALIKTGTGLQILSGISNSYTGGTTISGGNLQMNNASGSALGSGSVTLGSADPSATLSGTGSNTGLVTVANGGRIAPGTNGSTAAGATYANFGSAGTLTLGLTGGLSLNSANLDLDVASTAAGTSDLIVTGALNLTSVAVTFNGLGSGVQIGTPYVLIHYTSTSAVDASAFSSTNFVGTLASGGYSATYSLDSTNDNVDVTFSTGSVPEPSSLALLSLGGALLMRRRRRSSRHID